MMTFQEKRDERGEINLNSFWDKRNNLMKNLENLLSISSTSRRRRVEKVSERD